MTDLHIQRLLDSLKGEGTLIETHISWVILTTDRAYKIRKPIRYPFLDFSTLEQRRLDCEKELALNRRTSPQIYLDVVAIRQSGEDVRIGDGTGQIMDYAVEMVRLPAEQQMNLLVMTGHVDEADMQALARYLATFHRDARVIDTPVSVHGLWLDVADVLKVEWLTDELLGQDSARELRESVHRAKVQLHHLRERIRARHLAGWTRDVHGDLHTRNIFLLPEPVLFDCLEFNDHLRQIDLLNEIAFLGMDLGFLERRDLWKSFLDEYVRQLPVFEEESDRSILQFYMSYRANVRFKVGMLRVMQAPDTLDIELIRRSFRYAMDLVFNPLSF